MELRYCLVDQRLQLASHALHQWRPACATTSLSTNPVTAPYSPVFANLKIDVRNCGPADVGNYTITVTGTAAIGLAHSTASSLSLTDYTLSANPTWRTIPKGSSCKPMPGFRSCARLDQRAGQTC